MMLVLLKILSSASRSPRQICDPVFDDCSIPNTGATGDNHPNDCGPVFDLDCGIPFPYCYQASEDCSIPNAGPSEDCRPTPVSRESAAKGPTVRMWVQSPNFPASYPNNADEVRNEHIRYYYYYFCNFTLSDLEPRGNPREEDQANLREF